MGPAIRASGRSSMDEPTPRVLTSKQVAEMFCLSESRLRVLRMRGEGPAFIKLGGKKSAVRYFERDVLTWLEGRRVDRASEDLLANAAKRNRRP